MAAPKYKFQMYKNLQANIANIYAEAKEAAQDIVPEDLRGKFGLTGGVSGSPAPLRRDIMEVSEKGNREVIPLAKLAEELRAIVKEVYGDEWDAVATDTCEAAIWVTFDSLFTPPNMGRGDNYRTRYIVPWEKHLHHHGSYGRPFPPRFKDLFADRGTTPGELGFYGKRQNNTDTVIVPLEGAKYDCHGIKYHPVPLLTEVDPEASIEKMAMQAEIHESMLSGFTSLGYETPGYGYGAKDEDGVPLLQKYMADLAHSYDVPYVIDNAWGVPFIGHDPRKSGADIMLYSMDKASQAPTCGLIIGREDMMIPVRRALGVHGDRWGTTVSYGKAAYVTFDPGKEALLGLLQALRVIKDQPKVLTDSVDALEKIVKEELANSALPQKLKEGILVSKSYNSRAVEINYEGTWKNGEMGIPIFSIEDMYSGTAILQTGLSQIGVVPTVAYDGNIYMSPDLGTTDEEGQLIEDITRRGVKAQFALLEIVCKYAGLL